MVDQSKSIVDAYLFPMVRWTFVTFPEDAPDYPNIYAFHDRVREDNSVEKHCARKARGKLSHTRLNAICALSAKLETGATTRFKFGLHAP